MSGEEERLLQDHTDLLAQARLGQLADVLAVDEDGAAVDVIVSCQNIDDSRLAGAGGAADTDHLSRLGLKAIVLENLASRHIAEVHIFELDVAALELEVAGVRRVEHRRLLIDDGEDASSAGHGIERGRNQVGYVREWRC